MQNLYIRVLLNSLILCLFISPYVKVFSHPANHHGTIMGWVVDSQHGTPLAHVQVYVKSLQRGDVTDNSGKFEITRLPSGSYQLVFKLQGYKTYIISDVQVRDNQITEIKVELEPTVLEMDEVVVTAERRLAFEREIPQLISVVNARKILEKNIQQTSEALREVEGVFVQKTNQGGGSPIVRGLKANKLLQMVDGIRLNNATYRGGNIQYLNTVDAWALERMEVVHGPVSVLYGSDALGGAINMITKKPLLHHRPEYNWQASANLSFDSATSTKTSHINLMTANHRWGWLVEGSFRSFGDVRHGTQGGEALMQRLANDSRTKRILNKIQAPNAYTSLDLQVKSLVKLSSIQELTFAYQLNRQFEVPRYDVYEARKDSIFNFDPQERDLFYVMYQNNHATRFFHSATLTLSFHRQFERRIRQKFSSALQTMDQFRTWTTGFQMQFNKWLNPSHHLIYGMEVYYDQVATRSLQMDITSKKTQSKAPLFPDGSTYLTFGLFAQDRFLLTPKLNVTTGFRFSKYRLKAPFEEPQIQRFFGTIIQAPQSLTGSLGVVYELQPGIQWVTNVAQGFRAPNLDDVSKLGVGKGGQIFDIPNPDLKPEKSLNLDGGLKMYLSRFKLNMFGFYNWITDLLLRRPTTFQGFPFIVEQGDTLKVFRKENAGRAYTTGFEFVTQVLISPRLNLNMNLSYTYGKNITDDEPLTGVPPFHGYAGIRWHHPVGWFEFYTRFAAAQRRLSSEDREDLRIPEGGTPGWWTLNVRSQWQLFNNIKLHLSMTNLLDLNYREHLSGFNAPGRGVGIGVYLETL